LSFVTCLTMKALRLTFSRRARLCRASVSGGG
jgi:hypothetical protein